MFRHLALPRLIWAALLIGAAICLPRSSGALQPGAGGRAVIVEGRPGTAPIAAVMAAALRNADLEVRRGTLEQAAERAWWDALGDEIVALPEAPRMPAAARDGLVAFLDRGGKLFCAGAPLLGDPLFRVNGAWLTLRQLVDRRRATPVTELFDAGGPAAAARWQRASDNMAAPSRLTAEQSPHGAALGINVRGLRGWDNFARTFDAPPFRNGSSLTCFWARGPRADDHLAVEWQERDGSRWIAAVPIGRAWQRVVLTPRAFPYWPDSPTGNRRGGSGDEFHPAEAARLSVGFAASHRAAPGDHTAWIADLGSAPDPLPDAEARSAPPVVEGLSPAYNLFPLPAAFRVTQPAGRLWSDLPAGSYSPVPRHSGVGYNDARAERSEPILEVEDRDGLAQALGIWMVLRSDAHSPGAGWLCVGSDQPQFWVQNRDRLTETLSEQLRRLAGGVALLAAGADRFTAYPDEAVTFGARVVNVTGQPVTAVVDGDVWEGNQQKRQQLPDQRVSLPAHAARSVQWPARPLKAGNYRVTVHAYRLAPAADVTGQTLRHELVVLPRPGAANEERVTVRNGHFWLRGRRWFALGVNFWPRYVSGREIDDYRRSWLDPARYDPSVVEQDLESVRQLGMNCIAVQYTSPDQALPLRDFLRRCRLNGLRADIYLAGANPLQFDPPAVQELLAAADLAHDPAVFAYDLAWEPAWGREAERRRFEPEWRAWVTRRYGDVGRAAAAWGVPGQRNSQGELGGPTDAQVTRNGPWRKMVADYRRFQDDLLDERYAAVRHLIRSLDPHTLLGARTGWGGGPFINSPAMPFDHASGARQLDFISPEGWGLQGGRRDIERGAFIAAYDRLVSGGKPVFWAEFGYNCGYPLAGVTGPGSSRAARAELAHQRQYFEEFYRMVRLSGADGAMAWWLPGGYRVDERSDFGLLNPDRAPRPAAEAGRRFAAHLPPPAAPAPATWLKVDRFADARGPFALWEKDAGKFVRLQDQGRRVGLRAKD